MNIISIRKNPDYTDKAIAYFQKHWATENTLKVYEDCIKHTKGSEGTLPQWYLLMDGEKIIGCAGLITNDFISRMDLYPWVCALYIEEEARGNGYSKLLIDKAIEDTKNGGFEHIYLCTDHVDYYEKFGFSYIGDGYHPWGDTSRIYKSDQL